MPKRLVAIFVLLLLPLQLSFAAAAEYCELGKGDKGSHFGHHVHAGAGKVTDGKQGQGKSGETHCGFCQLGCSHSPLTAEFALLPTVSIVPDATDRPLLDGDPPPTLERPPRSALA